MPNYFAHLLFGAKMLKQLPEEAAAPIRAQREAFNLGCLGPDPLFFYRPVLPNAARREGLEMHHESAAPVFARLARALGSGIPEAEGYAAGFLCHFALDAACHPYVNARAAEGTVAHLAVEAELDRSLMENRGLPARGQVYLPPIREEAVFAAAERAYLWAGAAEVRRGYAAMRRDSLIFARGHGTRLGVTANRMVALLPACRSLEGVILPSSYLPERETFCAIAALALAFTMMGNYMKRNGLRVACRTASSAGEPYLVTLDEGKWNGQDAYAKWSGEPLGFGRQLQAPDGAERVYHVMAPLILLACFLFSVLSSLGRGRPEDLLWCLSATLSAASSLSATLCYAIPWRALSLRLAKSGAALAGWDGVVGTSGRSSILLTDHDLFPPGTVSLNGIKIFGDFPVEKVIGVTATLIRDSGCGLDKLFHDLLRAQGATYRRSSDFCCYEGGGVSAVIRNEVVLVGSASFMHLMEVPLPQGLHVKNAVFCAIDGDLAGLFALKYTLHGTVEPALYALIQNRIAPVLATRDFNIIPAMLQQRFKLPADRMEFPAVERRVELSSQEQEHSSVLTAVLCREGVGPFTEAAVGAKRLRTAVRASAWLTCLGSCAGTVLAFYLTFMAAYTSLTPLNLLVFLLMWLVPTVLISNWVNRY